MSCNNGVFLVMDMAMDLSLFSLPKTPCWVYRRKFCFVILYFANTTCQRDIFKYAFYNLKLKITMAGNQHPSQGRPVHLLECNILSMSLRLKDLRISGRT